jgi:hypothetical protein
MGVLEQVADLKNRGMSENEIISNLREQGASPRAINDALSQSQIKNAVSAQDQDSQSNTDQGMSPSFMRQERGEPLPTEGSAPSDSDLTPPPSFSRIPKAAQSNFGSMTQEYNQGPQQEQDYVPQPGDYPQYQEQGQEEGQEQEEYYPQDQYNQYQYSQQSPQEGYGGYQQQEYQQEYYPQESYAGYGAGVTNTDTMIEISEQVFSEKIKTINKQLESLNEFKTLAESKIDNMSERLKRIELSIDRLQSAILEKVGSYGRGLDLVKKEMSMMQDSFGKMINKSISSSDRKHHVIHRSKKETTVTHKSHPKAPKKSTHRRKTHKKTSKKR